MNLLLPLLLAANLADVTVPALSLESTDGQPRDVKAEVAKAPFTVFTFFSRKCPCVKAHDAVFKKLHEEFSARGVQFFVVDSEVGASLDADRPEVEKRGYPMPMLIDAEAKLSRELGVNFASTTVIVDREGHVRFRGGMDSARHEPTAETTPYLRDALTAVLGGTSPPVTEPKTLGCYLKRR